MAVLPAAGAQVKASDWLLPFPLGIGSATTYTPTLTQSATVTKTVEYAYYYRVGQWIMGQASLAVTGAGTAANNIVVGLPVASGVAYRKLGDGLVYDASANLWYYGGLNFSTGTTCTIQASGVAGALGSGAMTAALASGDVVTYTFAYVA